MSKRLPPELVSFLTPLMKVFGDVLKSSAEAAVDTALEEAEARVESVASRIAGARRNLRKSPRARRAPEAPEVVVEGSAKRRPKKRRR